MNLSRRRLLLAGLGVAGAAAAGVALRPARGPRRVPLATGDRPPNVLFVVADQERARHLLPAALALPQHDRLMAGATSLRNMHVVSALCSVSRGTLYTGLHPQHNGVFDNVTMPIGGDLRHDVSTVGHLFQDAGYTTGYFGKWHLSELPIVEPVGREKMARLLRGYGFEASDQDGERDGAQGGYRHDPESVQSALAFIARQRGGEQPWFAALNLVNPHDVMYFSASPGQEASRITHFPDRLAPEPDDPLFAEDLGFPLAETFGSTALAGKPAAQRAYQEVVALGLGAIPLEREDLWRRLLNYYYNCVRDVDRQLGVLLDGLEASGEADRTVLVFTADHGEMGGAHGLREKGPVMYRECTSVPFAVRHPDLSGGVEVDALASLIDVVPTLLSLAGVSREALHEAHPELPGLDLSPALRAGAAGDPQAGGRQAALMAWTSLIYVSADNARGFARMQSRSGLGKLAEIARSGPPDFLGPRSQLRAVFDGRYKYGRYFSLGDHHRPSTWEDLLASCDLELYDTLLDPGETTNLAADPETQRERITALNSTLDALIDREVGVDDGAWLPGPRSLWTS